MVLIMLIWAFSFSEIIGKRHQMSDEQEHKKEVGCDVPPVSLGSGFLHSLPPVPAFPWPENDFTRSIFFIVARFRRNAKDFL